MHYQFFDKLNNTWRFRYVKSTYFKDCWLAYIHNLSTGTENIIIVVKFTFKFKFSLEARRHLLCLGKISCFSCCDNRHLNCRTIVAKTNNSTLNVGTNGLKVYVPDWRVDDDNVVLERSESNVGLKMIDWCERLLIFYRKVAIKLLKSID